MARSVMKTGLEGWRRLWMQLSLASSMRNLEVEGDYPEPPSSECCASVVHVNTDCLCNALGQGDAESFPGMNVNAALRLPRECGRMVPKGFKCAGYLVPSYP